MDLLEYYVPASDEHNQRERKKARELRQSQWWRQTVGLGVCYYCRKPVSKEKLTMDHIMPVARGGKTTKRNVVAACKECNTKKKHYTLAELRLLQMKADEEI